MVACDMKARDGSVRRETNHVTRALAKRRELAVRTVPQHRRAGAHVSRQWQHRDRYLLFRGQRRRRDRADEHLSRADEREDAPGDPKVTRERFEKDAQGARYREGGGDVGEKADGDDRPAVKKLRLVGCLLRAGKRTHDLSCIKDRIETPRSQSYFDL